MNIFLNWGKYRLRIAGSFDDECYAGAVSLRQRPIHKRLGGLPQAPVLTGLDHTDDLETRLVFDCERDALTYGVAVEEVTVRHLLVDYHHARRCCAVLRIELAPLKHGNAHGLKIPRTHSRKAGHRPRLTLARLVAANNNAHSKIREP